MHYTVPPKMTLANETNIKRIRTLATDEIKAGISENPERVIKALELVFSDNQNHIESIERFFLYLQSRKLLELCEAMCETMKAGRKSFDMFTPAELMQFLTLTSEVSSELKSRTNKPLPMLTA